MTTAVSFVMVAYRSAEVARAAIESFRGQAPPGSEVIVVDHSEDQAEHARLAALVPDVLVARPNRGYAAGVNAGVAASRGEVLLVGNPDVEFCPGSPAALLAALDAGWDIVGPQFVVESWTLSPADEQTPHGEWRRFRASRSAGAWRRFFSVELRRSLAAWRATEPMHLRFLSGALLALRRSTWERLGPWDEGYFLYFEETDWLLRAVRAGARVALVPRARVVHRWAHAADPLATASVFAASRSRYLTRNFGLAGRLAVRLHPSFRGAAAPRLADRHVESEPVETLWLVSPSPLGFPAGSLTTEGRLPHDEIEALARLHPGMPFNLFAVDPRACTLRGSWRREAARG